MESGVARQPITNWDNYIQSLNKRLGLDNQVMRILGNKARRDPKRIVFAEADNIKILKAAQIVFDEGVGYPILLGDETKIRNIALANGIDLEGLPIFDPRSDAMEEKRNKYSEIFFAKRGRKGFNAYEAKKVMRDRNYFGCMMVECGDADAMISGLAKNYPDTIRPALQTIGTEEGVKKIAGMYLMLTKKGPLFLADTTVNFNPTAEELAEITLMVAKEVRNFNIIPPDRHVKLFKFRKQQLSGSRVGCKSKKDRQGKDAFAARRWRNAGQCGIQQRANEGELSF
jgi:malate dehydrogenase (oxaloacetate-decarboxylating)(NADP+)